MVEVLNAIYERDFLHCSHGFRPGRGQHQALEEVGRVICTRSTGWILELDITAYFDSIVREQLMEMIEKRISDDSVLQLLHETSTKLGKRRRAAAELEQIVREFESSGLDRPP